MLIIKQLFELKMQKRKNYRHNDITDNKQKFTAHSVGKAVRSFKTNFKQ